MRTVTPINNQWTFVDKWHDQYIDSVMPTNAVNIPHTTKTMPLNSFDEHDYQMHCGYQRIVNVSKDMLTGSIFVHFEAVAHRAVVYCNGHKVTTHCGGYTAFDANITQYVVLGDNMLTVEVDCREDADIPPFSGVIDYLCFGGIYREVQLVSVPTMHISRLQISATHLGAVDIEVTLSQPNSIVEGMIEISDTNGTAIYSNVHVMQNTANIHLQLDNIAPWDIDNPTLYNVKVMIEGDSLTDRFGFRTCVFTNKGFCLNGRQVKLLGLNRHQSYPYVGYAMPRALQEIDAVKVKASGCNIVRQSHYPQSRHFNNKCDEIGLLVFCEAPGWQSIGGEAFRDNYVSAVGEMIREHYNHPSIVVWGVRVNESQDCDELYTVTNALAHSLDSSRQTTGVRFLKKSHLLEDVYSYNDFLHTGSNKGTVHKSQVCGNVPLLVTEHNGHMFPTKPYDSIERRINHTLRHANVINSALGSNGTSGVIGWCFSDYNTHRDFGSGDRICYHGVTDMFRCPKTAHALYASQGQEPTLEILSVADLGDYSAMVRDNIVIASNCDYIKVFNNGNYVDTFYPCHDKYPNLPHPPYIIDHLLNGEVERMYGYSTRESKRILKALLAGIAGMQGLAIRLMIPIMIKHRKPMSYWQEMAMRVVNRNGENDNFVMVGYIDDKAVIEKPYGQAKGFDIVVSTPTPTVTLHDTYEIAQIDVALVDKHGRVSTYGDDVVTVTVEGGTVVGDSSSALIGGRRSFYISVDKAGTAKVTVNTNRSSGKVINIEVV